MIEMIPNKSLMVLVVDDNAELRLVIVEDLQDMGHKTIEAAGGHEALVIIKAASLGSIDVVLSDMRMPAGSGMELLASVNEMPMPRPPVILISGGSAVSHAEALASGAAGYLPKPYDIEELSKLLAQAAKVLED